MSLSPSKRPRRGLTADFQNRLERDRLRKAKLSPSHSRRNVESQGKVNIVGVDAVQHNLVPPHTVTNVVDYKSQSLAPISRTSDNISVASYSLNNNTTQFRPSLAEQRLLRLERDRLRKKSTDERLLSPESRRICQEGVVSTRPIRNHAEPMRTPPAQSPSRESNRDNIKFRYCNERGRVSNNLTRLFDSCTGHNSHHHTNTPLEIPPRAHDRASSSPMPDGFVQLSQQPAGTILLPINHNPHGLTLTSVDASLDAPLDVLLSKDTDTNRPSRDTTNSRLKSMLLEDSQGVRMRRIFPSVQKRPHLNRAPLSAPLSHDYNKNLSPLPAELPKLAYSLQTPTEDLNCVRSSNLREKCHPTATNSRLQSMLLEDSQGIRMRSFPLSVQSRPNLNRFPPSALPTRDSNFKSLPLPTDHHKRSLSLPIPPADVNNIRANNLSQETHREDSQGVRMRRILPLVQSRPHSKTIPLSVPPLRNANIDLPRLPAEFHERFHSLPILTDDVNHIQVTNLREEYHQQIEREFNHVYESTINKHCEFSCEICTKLCYRSQIRDISTPNKTYLPPELQAKPKLRVCKRCLSHLTSAKTTHPSKAYWNHLDPGPIPDVLRQLTQCEIRLLARMIPFVKIIKLKGRFGQYGFKGQAILFAQDIHEITESLPTMLPRSPENAGIVIITEHLENLNITREYEISRERVYPAADWLLINNELYGDVIINRNMELSSQDLVRVVEPRPEHYVDPQAENNFYKPINSIASILRASWNHFNSDIFDCQYVGKQSCTMALANIIRSFRVSPAKWKPSDLDENLVAGDRMYGTLVRECNGNNSMPENGLLQVAHFAVLRESFSIFGVRCCLEFNDPPDYTGDLSNNKNTNDQNCANITLHNALFRLFDAYPAGILSAASHNVAVLKLNGIFYFADSQPCGPKGARAGPERGKACVIACDTLAELQRICKRAFHPKKSDFAVHHVTVVFEKLPTENIPRPLSTVGNTPPQPPGSTMNSLRDDRPCQSPSPEAYMTVNEIWQIVRATTHQGNDLFFPSGFAGVQCCAMALANLCRAHILPPDRWSTDILDENLIAGDYLYSAIRNATPISEIGPTGHLQLRNFCRIKESFIIFDNDFSVQYADDTELFGNIKDSLNDGVVGLPLLHSLTILFDTYDSSILIVGDSAYGIMKHDNNFYMTDSHSCDSSGMSTDDGRACVIRCATLTDLHKLCQFKFGNRNVVYNLHYIQLTTEFDYVLDDILSNNNEVAYDPHVQPPPYDGPLTNPSLQRPNTQLSHRVVDDFSARNTANQQYPPTTNDPPDSGGSLHYTAPATLSTQNLPPSFCSMPSSSSQITAHCPSPPHVSGSAITADERFPRANMPERPNLVSHDHRASKDAPASSMPGSPPALSNPVEYTNKPCQPTNVLDFDAPVESPSLVDNNRDRSTSVIQQIPIQTSVMLPNDPPEPDVEEALNIEKETNRITRKTTNNIVNVDHELRAEEFAWYHLFPYGVNGLREPARTVKITPLDYFQHRILGTDPRFQRNDYLFYALSTYEYHKVKSTINACGKKVRGPDGMVEDLHLYMQNLRGSASYWGKSLLELLAMIRCLGPPHYFGTFSCNDLHWMSMKKALLIADGRPDVDPETLDVQATQRLIEMYPVVVARHFVVHVYALMKRMKNDPSIFDAKLVDHWWRIEFQSRGSPHLHMVVWLENYPAFDTPEGLAKIDKVISCALPDENSPDYENVSKCQIHRHTDTCRKKDGPCRFFFPREECHETHVIAETSDEFIRGGHRAIAIKRRKEERWVNNYSPKLLRMWKGNMDWSPCGTTKAIAFYICKYVAKSEPTKLNAAISECLKEIMQEDTNISQRIFKACMKILHEREVSASESAFRLAHLPLRHSSRKCVFLNTRRPNIRYRLLDFDDNGEHVGFCCNIFDRYEKRPTRHAKYDFINMCLLEFAMRFEAVYKKNDDEDLMDVDLDENDSGSNDDKVIRLLDGKKMRIRSRPAVVRVPYFSVTAKTEDHCYSMLVQYLPFRSEEELLDGFTSAKEAFLAKEDSLKQMNEYMQIYRQRDQQLESAFEQIQAFNIMENMPMPEEEPEVENIDVPMEDDQFQNELRSLNLAQREIVQLVTRSVYRQINGDSERLKIFVTGNAGTGKTKVLRVLEEQLNRCYQLKVVKKCALTGAATILTRGSTIHSLLKLPVQRDGKITKMAPLSGLVLRRMRLEWQDIKFIFIDEISMVPYEMLCMIDSRLRQIKSNENSFFGGINVILFGDLMQLKPIQGHQVFCQPEQMAPATHLWRLFQLIELTQNMRQQGDRTFVDILNALRIGAMRQEHFSELMKRVHVDWNGDFAPENALRIYPTNAQVSHHNNQVLEMYRARGTQMFTIVAHDILVDATRDPTKIKLEDITPTDINKTGGLPKVLEIFVGAKIMLRSNINVSKGLVNGSIGVITKIEWPYFRREQVRNVNHHDFPKVFIKFGDTEPQEIGPKSIQFPANNSYGTIERRMLPMILCWATTVHKMQGSTVDRAVVYLGPKMFAPGQAYVALSRVRSLEGLAIEELDCTQLTGLKPCNLEAMAEMDRLRNIGS